MADSCFELREGLGGICVMRIERRRGHILVTGHLELLFPPASVQLSLEILEAERQIISYVFIVRVNRNLLLIGDLSLLFGIHALGIIIEKGCLVVGLGRILRVDARQCIERIKSLLMGTIKPRDLLIERFSI